MEFTSAIYCTFVLTKTLSFYTAFESGTLKVHTNTCIAENDKIITYSHYLRLTTSPLRKMAGTTYLHLTDFSKNQLKRKIVSKSDLFYSKKKKKTKNRRIGRLIHVSVRILVRRLTSKAIVHTFINTESSMPIIILVFYDLDFKVLSLSLYVMEFTCVTRPP